jgi:hypothetical protein
MKEVVITSETSDSTYQSTSYNAPEDRLKAESIAALKLQEILLKFS